MNEIYGAKLIVLMKNFDFLVSIILNGLRIDRMVHRQTLNCAVISKNYYFFQNKI